LAVLAELQPSFIKVDMSIVRGVDTDPRKQRLINLLCRFSEATQASFVAEGVETEAEAQTLRDCGAHLLQGYIFGKPNFEPQAALQRFGAARAVRVAG
jgi:EAL domain-containing protein (putative c-di-GMP-specific phosphodiesterase class I)